MKIIAHRGKRSVAVENSLQAIKAALEDNHIYGVEIDVRESLDKEFVVIHDSFISRVTDGRGMVKSMTFKELEKFGIPRLKDVLNIKTNKLLLLELKDIKMDVKSFAKLVNRYDKKNIYVMSFYSELIHKLIGEKANVRVGVLNYVFNSEKNYDEYDFIGLLESVVSLNIFDYFKERNIEVFVYGFTSKKLDDVLWIERVYSIIDV